MDLVQLLAERERRWNERLDMAGMHARPVLSLTLNIPGPDKNLPGAEAALQILRAALREAVLMAGGTLLDECRLFGPDGPCWIAAVNLDALVLKELAVAVEEHHALGRLADADVMTAQGQPVNREHLPAAVVHGGPEPDGPEAGGPKADGPEAGGQFPQAESRGRAPRQCFLCDRPASLCRRERRHSLEELLAAVRGMLRLASQTAEQEQACLR